MKPKSLITLLITLLIAVGAASTASAKPKKSRGKTTVTTTKTRDGRTVTKTTKTKTTRGRKAVTKTTHSRRSSHHHAGSSKGHRAQRNARATRHAPRYTPVWVGKRQYHRHNGRYYQRTYRSGAYRYVEHYPVGARYDRLPGHPVRVVRRNQVVFRIGSAFFKPMYQSGRTYYRVVR